MSWFRTHICKYLIIWTVSRQVNVNIDSSMYVRATFLSVSPFENERVEPGRCSGSTKGFSILKLREATTKGLCGAVTDGSWRGWSADVMYFRLGQSMCKPLRWDGNLTGQISIWCIMPLHFISSRFTREKEQKENCWECTMGKCMVRFVRVIHLNSCVFYWNEIGFA